MWFKAESEREKSNGQNTVSFRPVKELLFSALGAQPRKKNDSKMFRFLKSHITY